MFDGSLLDLPFPALLNKQQFNSAIQPYYMACEELYKLLAQLFALVLDLPINYIVNKIDNSFDIMRLLNYPIHDKQLEDDQRMPEHTDDSLFTFITSTSSGIEYEMEDGSWLNPIVDKLDCIFINLGNSLKYWSNDTYISPRHRVVLPKSKKRQSIAFLKVLMMML